MSTSLTVSAPQVDQEAILRALSLNPADPKTQALVLTCARYGLDPLLKHAVLIQGALYVTRDGLLHVAHESGRFDGLEVEQLPETPTHYVAMARVWRKDMGRPFAFQGRYPKQGKSGPGASHGPEMAEKVAVCRALRHAFDVALCSREEAWEEEPQPIRHRPEATQGTGYPGPATAQSEKVPPGLSWETAKAMDALADALKAAEGWEPVYLPSGFLSPKAIREKAVAVLERHRQPTDGRDWLEPGTWDAVRALVEMGDPDTMDAEVIDPELAAIADPFAKEEQE